MVRQGVNPMYATWQVLHVIASLFDTPRDMFIMVLNDLIKLFWPMVNSMWESSMEHKFDSLASLPKNIFFNKIGSSSI